MFKKIPGFENYIINDEGDVISLNRNFLKRKIHLVRGYKHIILYKDSKPHNFFVHRLVLRAFVGISNLDVNHKNGIKTDNRLINLEYCTKSENTLHMYRVLGTLFGQNHGMAKLNDVKVREIKKSLKNGVSLKELASAYNVTRPTIGYIKSGKTWGHVT